MPTSVDNLTLFIDEQTEQLRRASKLEYEGNTQLAKALEEEWTGSALDTLYLNVDCFVRL